MKGFDSLIRLHRHALDQLRQELVRAEGAREAILAEHKRLGEEIDRERHLAEVDPVSQSAFAGFLARTRTRQGDLAGQAHGLAVEIERLHEELARAFKEVKTFELLEAERLQREALVRARLDQQALDETGTIAHVRAGQRG